MKRFLLYGMCITFCFIVVQTVYGLTYEQSVFLKNYSERSSVEKISFFQLLINDIGLKYFDLKEDGVVEEDAVICNDPTVIKIGELTADEVTVKWEDSSNSLWEYYLQDAALPVPSASGTLTGLKSNQIKVLSGSGTPMQADTEYDFYVRSICDKDTNVNGKWIGPIRFKTPCLAYNLPFTETFNAVSTSFGCWGIIDNNRDEVSTAFVGVQNTWITSTTAQEGGRGMYFNGKNTVSNPHDDWLVSPPLVMDASKVYRLEYYYRTLAGTAYVNEFEVLASASGSGPDNFKTIVVAKDVYTNTSFIKASEFVTGLGGEVTFAFRISGTNEVRVYIDSFSIVEVINCPEPINLGIKDLDDDKVTLTWEDNFSAKEWEYVVQSPGNGLPTGTGVKVSSKSSVVNMDNTGTSLTANTQYEYYVRTVCADGTYSDWSGPFSFTTMCSVFGTPYWDGFNSNLTNNCWTIINGNDDTNKWVKNGTGYEGGYSMYFSGSGAGKTHDDWLVTPRVKMDKTKGYRLMFHYRNVATAVSTNELEVLLSSTGTEKSDFKTIVIPKKEYETYGNWMEERTFITGVEGDIQIGFHLVTEETSYFYIDNVFIEEVVGCPEPVELKVEDVKSNEVNLVWRDDINKNGWEYYVQESGKGEPKTKGTSTKTKKNNVLKLSDGTVLEPNTQYEYYVRSVCGNGEYSIWNGPFVFYTACAVSPIPYWEGFNTDSETKRCWTIVDGNKDALDPAGSNIWRNLNFAHEGDRGMDFYGVAGKIHDDWLISPSFDMDGGTYVLKYHYKTRSAVTMNIEFEVLLSQNGIATNQFKKEIVSKKVYREDNYVEEVVFIKGVKGTINLAWHVITEGTAYVYLDNVFLKKVETCPEPFYLTVTGQTSSSIDIEWEQTEGITEWEVFIGDYLEDAPANPSTVIKVSGVPELTLNGLQEGKGYTIYVRAICDDNGGRSDWGTPVNTSTFIGANDICEGAINIPVNSGIACVKSVEGSFLNASFSVKPESICESSKAAKRDVWFEFTATATEHMLILNDYYSISNASLPNLNASLYDQSCSNITNNAIHCFNMTKVVNNEFLTNLIVGQKYYLRLGFYSSNSSTPPPDFVFSLCLTTAESGPLEVSPSGEKYSVEELVKDVLIQSECDLVSNIKFQAGNNTAINTLGYFNKGNSVFPFEEGIVLATGDVKHIPGPHTYKALNDERNKVPAWAGDPDLNDVIEQIGGAGFGSNKYVSVLEFDFVPITDSIKFEYLFASQSYHKDCGNYSCREGGAIFAAWLTDIETGEGQNLALVPGTDLPIALSTIRDTKKAGTACESVNPEFYWKHYANNVDSPLEAPINFAGLTVPMSSETVKVKSCKKYRIKLAVADFCTSKGHTSAVFFNAGSFNIGKIDLGKDLLIETNNAICSDEIRIINSGIGTSDCGNTDIEWFKDGEIIPNEKSGSLNVNESGSYEIKVKYTDINCESSGSIRVEMYEPISKYVGVPSSISVCRNSLNSLRLNLGKAELNMFKAKSRDNYNVEYYLSKQDAVDGVNPINDISNFSFNTRDNLLSFYIRIEDKITGCYEIFTVPVVVEEGSFPEQRDDVVVCATYTFPSLNSNQYYYSEAAGSGKEFFPGDILDIPGDYTIYLLQKNNEEGCYEEVSYQVTVTELVKATIFEDKTLDCEVYFLNELPANNAYFDEPGGKGRQLIVGAPILKTQTIYVYASSEDGVCVDENSFTISYEDCPIQKGISPNGDGVNDYFDLSKHRVSSLKIYNRFGSEVYSHGKDYTIEWAGQDKSGNKLPDGTYYYVVISDGKTRTGWVHINK